MRIFLPFFCLFLLSLSALSGQTFNAPESLDYHPASGYWFISNKGAQQILRKSVSGAPTIFAGNLGGSPHGLEIIGDTLYVNVGGRILGYDINTTQQVLNLNLGASFLNGLTADPQGILYAADFSAKKIYRIDPLVPEYQVLVENTISTPNGIVYDPFLDRLVFCNWGSNAPVKAVNLQTAEVSTITTTALTNCDGIVRDSYGDYYISSWSPQTVTVFRNNFNGNIQQLTTGLSNAADLGFDFVHDTLGIPNSGAANNVVFIGIQHNGPEFQGIGAVIYDTICVNETYERVFTAADADGDALIYNVYIDIFQTPALGWTPLSPNSAKIEGFFPFEGDYSYYIEANGYEQLPDTVTVFVHVKPLGVSTNEAEKWSLVKTGYSDGHLFVFSEDQDITGIKIWSIQGTLLHDAGAISAKSLTIPLPGISVVLAEITLRNGAKQLRKVAIR